MLTFDQLVEHSILDVLRLDDDERAGAIIRARFEWWFYMMGRA